MEINNKMNTIKFIVVVSIALLSTDLSYHQIVNGQINQTETETRTFENCFNENTISLTLGFLFVPFEKLSIVDVQDPAWKTLITNVCNFYHEKTRIWINSIRDKDIIQQYQQEFNNKYFDTYPEKLKEIIE
jgi:hypothetical protein